MKEMQKKLTKTLKEGNRVTSVFKETLAHAEEHHINLKELHKELTRKQEELAYMVKNVEGEIDQTESVIKGINNILGQ